MESTIAAPSGMRQVTESEFFAALHADKRDIMPNVQTRDYSNWLVVGTGAVWGRRYPGWNNPGDDKACFLVK